MHAIRGALRLAQPKRQLAIVVVATGLVAVCVPAGSANNLARQSKKDAGTLTVAYTFTSTATADPAKNNNGNAIWMIAHACYDTLLTLKGGDFKTPVPDAAASYTLSKDAKTITFKLRKDIKFADGTPLTSADALFSFQRAENVKGNPSTILQHVTFEAPDAYTFIIHSSVANAALPLAVTYEGFAILNSAFVKANGGTDAPDASTTDKATYLQTHTAGSGPYILDTYSPPSEIDLVPNPNYWGSPKPAWSKVVIVNQTGQQQLLSVQNTPNEVSSDIPITNYGDLQGKTNIKVDKTLAQNTFFVLLSDNPLNSVVTANLHVQKAIRYAIDYQALLGVAGPGSKRSPGIIPQGILGALPLSESIRQNLPLAKTEWATAVKQLTAAGVSSPSVAIEYPTNFSSQGVNYTTIAQWVGYQLQQAGIPNTITGSPFAIAVANYQGGKEAAGVWQKSLALPDPSTYLVFQPGGSFALRAGWKAGADPVAHKAAVKASLATTTALRDKYYQDFQRVLDERGPFVPLFQPVQLVAYSNTLTGVYLYSHWIFSIPEIRPK